jgi:hypothetical protein
VRDGNRISHSKINLSVLTHMVLTDDFVIIPRLRRYPRSAKPFGLRDHGTNPWWRMTDGDFLVQTKSDDFRSFGPKSDDFKISEVGERLFKILRWKLDFFEKNKILKILGQKPTERNFFENFEKFRKNIFSRTFHIGNSKRT